MTNKELIAFAILISVFLFNQITCERRITDGHIIDANGRFMVYLLKAPKSNRTYSAWLCGGCIVHPNHVLTAASCLADVQYVYVVSGYKKYVTTDEIDNDACTKRYKKKIVSYCYQNTYALNLDEIEWWNYRDIALAQVDTPFDFQDTGYTKYCSYRPLSLPVSFHREFQKPGIEVMTFGWGSSKYYRPVGDGNDYNEAYLRYSTSVIIDADSCIGAYQGQPYNFSKYPRIYWICTNYTGHLDEYGHFTAYHQPVDGCSRRTSGNRTCKDLLDRGFRRSFVSKNETFHIFSATRRGGICQNDHGGPLVSWIGGKPYVLGVATTFIVDAKMRCIGPFIFTPTLCNSLFLACALSAVQRGRRAGRCNDLNVTEKEFPWKNYSYH